MKKIHLHIHEACMRKWSLLILAVAIIAIQFLSWKYTYRMEIPEDAYITFRVAHNWAVGNGPVFNPGDRVEAYTNPLWMGLLALVNRLGLEMHNWAWKLSFFFYLLLLLGVYRRFQERGAFAVLLVAAYNCFCFNSLTGIETVPFLLALFCTADAFWQNRIKSAVFFGLISWLLRTDGAVYMGIALSAIAFYKGMQQGQWRQEGTALLKVLAMILLCYLPVLVWRYSYYGYLMPNTYYAKTKIGFLLNLKFGYLYFRHFFLDYFFWFAAVIIGLMAVAKEDRKKAGAIAGYLSLTFAYIWYVGGDTSSGGVRFFLPTIFVGCLLPLSITRKPMKNIVILLLMAGAIFSFAFQIRGRIIYNQKALPGSLTTVGKAFGESLPGGITLAAGSIGNLGYYSPDVIIMDPLGLADRDVAHDGQIISRAIKGHVKQGWSILLEKKNPDCFWIYMDLVAKGTDLSKLTWAGPNDEELKLLKHPAFEKNYFPIPVKVAENRYAVLHCKEKAAERIYK